MKMTDKLAQTTRLLGASLTSLVAVMLRSRPVPRIPGESQPRPLLVLGNGPSLNDTLTTDRAAMEECDLMAVNFAANAPVFQDLKPNHYVLADPYFFTATDDNAKLLWHSLESVAWPLTLHLPASEVSSVRAKKWAQGGSARVLRPFNMTAAEGFPALTRWLLDRGLAMPRPRNVMIPAIMAGIRLGYKRILLAGADHSWTRTLSVADDNTVVSVQPHFYADNDKEHQRVASVYKDVKLHQVLGSMVVAFRSYHEIADYARRRGIEIFNVTPGSFIDAFPRRKLSD